MSEKKITIICLIEKNVYDAVNTINELTLKTKDAIYHTKITKKEYGMIAIGEIVKITGILESNSNEIKEPTIEWGNFSL